MTGIEHLAPLTGHDGAVGAVTWLRAGNRLATVSSESGLLVYEGPDFQPRTNADFAWGFATLASHPKRPLIAGIAKHMRSRNPAVTVVEESRLGLIDASIVATSEYDALAWSNEESWLAHLPFRNAATIYRRVSDGGFVPASHPPLSGPGGALAWSPTGQLLAGSRDGGGLSVWDQEFLEVAHSVPGDASLDACWSPDGGLLAYTAGSSVALVDARRWTSIFDLEHAGQVLKLAWSHCGRFLASLSATKGEARLTIWHTDTWRLLESVDYAPPSGARLALAFSPTEDPVLAFTVGDRREVQRARLNPARLLQARPSDSHRYATAKLVILGETGAGKTGLAYRLATGEFTEHSSTHGQHFLLCPALGTQRRDGAECDAVLWDLAGQRDYRLIHVLFTDDADVAIVLIDLSRGPEALTAARFWLKALRVGRAASCPIILVASRQDRGTGSVTSEEMSAFAARYGAVAFVRTSAQTGEGIAELLDVLRDVIPWNQLPATVTTGTFRSMKDVVLRLKQSSGRGDMPTVMSEEEVIERAVPPGERGKRREEVWHAVRHLALHGYVRPIRTGDGDRVVLLRPELLNNLAASIVLSARRNDRGLGAIDEQTAVEGGYSFSELAELTSREGAWMLDAALELLLAHNVCFRETLGERTLLIFPELINEKPPLLTDGSEFIKDVGYIVSGDTQNAYAALVVLLGYTNVLVRRDQWQDQAEFELDGIRVRLSQQVLPDASIELTLLYAPGAQAASKSLFQGLLEQFLRRRDVSIKRYPAISCPTCGVALEQAQVIRFVDRGVGVTYCPEDGSRIAVPNAPELPGSEKAVEAAVGYQSILAARRTRFAMALTHIRREIAERRDVDAPRCFISYAWGSKEHERWVANQLVRDLQHADVDVIFDRLSSRPGDHIGRFISSIERATHVIVVGTPDYRDKYENEREPGSVVAAEMDLIMRRLLGTEEEKATVIPVLREGSERNAFPPMLQGRVYADLRSDEAYFRSMLEILLRLWDIRPDTRAAQHIIGLIDDFEGEAGL